MVEERVEIAVEMLHNLTMGKEKAEQDIYDMKETLGQVTRDTKEIVDTSRRRAVDVAVI